MEDNLIIEMFNDRDEKAISELSKKYGKYFSAIAVRILCNYEDAKDCVNDSYLKTWNTIPPACPNVLKAFVGRIVKCVAVSMLRMSNAVKRGNGEIPLVFDELSECVSGDGSVENEYENKQIIKEINKFLWKCSEFNRRAFILRYWHCESIGEIAKQLSVTENKVSISLHRTRCRLKEHLEKEGYVL